MMIRPYLTALALAPLGVLANNIQVSNVSLTGKNTTNDTYQVQFDIGWDNSWRTSTGEANYDAAWIFIKFRLDPSLPWNHATLSAAGHSAPSGSTINVPADQKGAFIFRNSDGIGNVTFAGAQLQWNYGASGVPDNAVIEVRVMAVEMVQVPAGPFAIGDGSTSTDIFGQYEAGQTGAAFQVTGEASIVLGGNGAGNLNARNNGTGFDDYNYSTTQTLPATYPKGFNAFYGMKYELTEGQYVDFLNMLTPTQAASRFPNLTGTEGHTIDDNGPLPEIYVSSVPERACGGLSFNSQMAYADWAALRPMSEFEYEKMCRGNRPAIVGERAWGTAALHASTITLNNTGTANEALSGAGITAVANHININLGNRRPWRSGSIAAGYGIPTRIEAGAGYYGAMELCGNLVESYVATGTADARGFLGAAMGDGVLTVAGAADVASWPTVSGSVQRRGGGYFDSTVRARVSDRGGASFALTNVNQTNGCRLGRTP